MDNFDIIGALKSYADTNEMHFLSGSNWYQNYEASQNVYEDGQLVLACDFNASPVYSKSNALTEIRYDGVIMLGIKFDADGDAANLDETFYQKYISRLKYLMQQLNTTVQAVACANELTITSVRTTLDLNKFDTNIDFAAFQITFVS